MVLPAPAWPEQPIHVPAILPRHDAFQAKGCDEALRRFLLSYIQNRASRSRRFGPFEQRDRAQSTPRAKAAALTTSDEHDRLNRSACDIRPLARPPQAGAAAFAACPGRLPDVRIYHAILRVLRNLPVRSGPDFAGLA